MWSWWGIIQEWWSLCMAVGPVEATIALLNGWGG
jgi:hypothetical protein